MGGRSHGWSHDRTPGNVVWAGAFVRRNIGRLRLSAIAAYDTHNGAPMGQVQAEFTLWKK